MTVNATLVQVSISAGASLSSGFTLAGSTILGIYVPSNFTQANLSFQGSDDGVSYGIIYDDLGNEVTRTIPTVGSLMYIAFTSGELAGVNYLKIKSGTTASGAINQTNAVVLGVAVRSI